MVKEKLTLDAIKTDFMKIAYQQIFNKADWRLTYIIPITLLAIIIGALLKNIVIRLVIFSIAAYHIVRYVIEYKAYRAKKKAITEAIERGDFAISVERLSHITEETVYEPHIPWRRIRTTKGIKRFYFQSAFDWRMPLLDKHYEWCKEFYGSTKGLENMSIGSDELFCVFLQEYHDVAYVYPCKIFELDSRLVEEY